MEKDGEKIESIIKELIQASINDKEELEAFKRKMAKKYKVSCPTNISLLETYHKMVEDERIEKSKELEKILRTRPVRSLSGIINISVLTKPYPCPGKCIYCPQQKNTPKSYLKGEPAVMRAELTNYDPYKQVEARLKSLAKEGHPTDKIELRIIGATWSHYPKQYQENFVKRCFDACNEKESKSLKEAQKLNEDSDQKIIGLSIETRPDFIDKKEIEHLRKLGVTRVEIGVQTIYNDILELVKRDHKVKASIKATKLLKNAGFKVCYQMMPGLPGSNLKKDERMSEKLFKNPNFKPDLLKIYPTVLLKEAPLYKWYKEGKYEPYSEGELIELLRKIKKKIPYYVRIQRIIRDIPAQRIVAGSKTSNLREIVQEKMKEKGEKCNCIRCREVRKGYDPNANLKLFRQDYEASEGKEIFLSFEAENENQRKLYALLRLRVPTQALNDKNFFIPALNNAALIREVHTYGQMIPVEKEEKAAQHKGLGKKLIKKAEKIAKKEFNLNKIAVISGIGARNYFRKRGYKLEDTYMVKK